MKPNNLPLLELFYLLQENGLLLGIDDYILLLRSLQAGFGVGDRNTLKQLCYAIWIKSDTDRYVFDYLYDQLFAQSLKLADESLPEIPPNQVNKSDSEYSQKPLQNEFENRSDLSRDLTQELIDIQEPIQIVEAIRLQTNNDTGMNQSRYETINNYFPVTRRQMKRSWHHLRYMKREGKLEEIDVKSTIEKIGHDGVFVEPVLLPQRQNRARVSFFIDRDGSMVPFHSLSSQLLDSARSGGKLGQASAFYFHNCPDQYVYTDQSQLEGKLISEVLETIGERGTILVISDAGAARGSNNMERLENTSKFISQIRKAVRHCAWLNPVPRDRWKNSIAFDIAQMIPMFEMSNRGLYSTIKALSRQYI